MTTWKYCKRSGYNYGAAVIMEPGGILVTGGGLTQVPPGATAFSPRKDDTFTQFASHPRSVRYVYMVFNTDALVAFLGEHMPDGYTISLHTALRQAQEYLLGDRAPTNARLVALRNPVQVPGRGSASSSSNAVPRCQLASARIKEYVDATQGFAWSPTDVNTTLAEQQARDS